MINNIKDSGFLPFVIDMNENQEILRRALNLTLAIYRLTERFPEKEILSWQLRRLGNEIIGDLTADDFSGVNKKTKLLLIYFKIGRAQKWVKDINWLVLEKEYSVLAQEVSDFIGIGGSFIEVDSIRPEVKKAPSRNIVSHNAVMAPNERPSVTGIDGLHQRQQKIFKEIEDKGSVRMSDLIPLFKNEVSERTLRNDLRVLLERGLIIKTGSHKSTVYFQK